jgi:predicted acyltransferase
VSMIGRDRSLDALRGLTILLMVLVNLPGTWSGGYSWLYHAPWHGLTLADLVFPWFLLIVGLSAPLALDPPRPPQRFTAIMRRTLLLIVIGIILGWLIKPSLDLEQIRWVGVLQRIGLVYVGCVLVMRWAPSPVALASSAAAILIVHSVVLLQVPAPGAAQPSLAAGEGISAWLDQWLVPGKLHHKSWDPEGALSTLPALASALIGAAVMRAWRGLPDLTVRLAGAGLLLTAAGFALAPLLPLNKALWTASFTLATAGFGLLAWAGLRAAWPSWGQSALLRLMVWLGEAALTLYVAHMLFIALLVRKLPSGESLWARAFEAVSGFGLATAPSSLLFALLASAITVAVLVPLRRRGWVLKV